MLKTKKVELFNMWLENDMSWDRVQCVVERQQTSSNLSRKEWVAVQAKDLKTRLPEDRFNELIKRRTEAGLYYPDEDYPDDDMDWFVESWAQKVSNAKDRLGVYVCSVMPLRTSSFHKFIKSSLSPQWCNAHTQTHTP